MRDEMEHPCDCATLHEVEKGGIINVLIGFLKKLCFQANFILMTGRGRAGQHCIT